MKYIKPAVSFMVVSREVTDDGSKQITFSTDKASMDKDLKKQGRLHYGWIDKTETGTGCTTFAIATSVRDTVVVVPSVGSAKDKVFQYKNFNSTDGFRQENEHCKYCVLGVWGDVETKKIGQYMKYCKDVKQPAKIVCCYDSLPRLEKFLNEKFDIVLDEMQKIIEWAPLKTKKKNDEEEGESPVDVYNKMMMIAEKHKDRVTFLSATPLKPEYYYDWVGELPRWQYVWPTPSNRQPIMIESKHPYSIVQQEIVRPLVQDGVCVIKNEKGNEVVRFSSAIIYMNSVKNIAKIVEDEGLTDEYGVICGENIYNVEELNKLNIINGGDIGDYKLVFVTSRGFDTIDLYHANSIDIVVSQCDQNYHMISKANVVQSIGRNRDVNNTHRHHFLWIYDRKKKEKIKEDQKKLKKDLDRMEYDRMLLNEMQSAPLEDTFEMTEEERQEDLERQKKYDYLKDTFQESESFSKYVYYDKGEREWRENKLTVSAEKYLLEEVAKLYAEDIEDDNVWERIEEGKKPIRIKYRDGWGDVSYGVISRCYRSYLRGLAQHSGHEEEWLHECFNDSQLRDDKFKKLDAFYKLHQRMPNGKKELDCLKFNEKFDQLKSLIGGAFVKGRTYKNKEVKEALAQRYNEVGLPKMPNNKLHIILEGFGYKVEPSHSGNDKTLKILKTPR